MLHDQQESDAATTPFFDDNPSEVDLLSYGGTADAVVQAILSPHLDPVTVGIQAAWGGGKSTVLNLVGQRLADEKDVLVVRIDPWEFEDAEDVRGTLINEVLNALQSLAAGEDEGRREKFVARLNGLRRRIAWGRVAKVIITSAATQTPDIAGLVDALTPKSPADADEAPEGHGMTGFRSAFRELIASADVPVHRVVVLVDDLDRCLPAAVVSSMEAIKLFLSVPGMAFVLAADEDLIRAAVSRRLGDEGGEFARLYTEKIVQIPVSLPRLLQADAEAYLAVLLHERIDAPDDQALTDLMTRVQERRRTGAAPYVVRDGDDLLPSDDVLSTAETIAKVLTADQWNTPRAVKRLLNNLAVRQRMAAGAGGSIRLDAMARLYVLELRHPSEFKMLAESDAITRQQILQQIEQWGHSEEEASHPDGVALEVEVWAASEPRLAERMDEVNSYLSLAASLRVEVRLADATDPEIRQVMEQLLSKSATSARQGQDRAKTLDRDRREQLVRELCRSIGRRTSATKAAEGLGSLLAADQGLSPLALRELDEPSVRRSLKPPHVPFLREIPGLVDTLRGRSDVPEMTKRALTSLKR